MNEADNTVAPWHALLEQLHGHFHGLSQYQCLLWVDPAKSDPFEANPAVERARVRTSIRHPRFDPARAPYVVRLELSQGADAEVLRDSVELAWLSWGSEHLSAKCGQPICGWVSGDADAKVLTSHWARHCHLHIQPRRAKLLRFQDPGVREWLWPVLNETQQHAILGPAAEVCSIGREQGLIHHRTVTRHVRSPQGGYPALELNHAQWEQVEDYASVHAAWLTWRNSRHEERAVVQEVGWERCILGALAQATRLGVQDVADRELYALHALQLGAGFDQNPRLKEVWLKTQAGDFYGSAIEEVTGHPADQLAAFINRPVGDRNEGRHG